MVAFLLAVPYLIIALGIYTGWRLYKKHKGTPKAYRSVILTVVGTLIALSVFHSLSLGYVGKTPGAAPPAPTVEDFAAEAEAAPPIHDIQRKPVLVDDAEFAAKRDLKADKAAREAKTVDIEK